MTTPTFGNKASGKKSKPEDAYSQDPLARAYPKLVGPLRCRLCQSVGQHVQERVRNIAGTGFRAFPCCQDRDACRDRRGLQGKEWPLIDASKPSFVVLLEEET